MGGGRKVGHTLKELPEPQMLPPSSRSPLTSVSTSVYLQAATTFLLPRASAMLLPPAMRTCEHRLGHLGRWAGLSSSVLGIPS